MAACCRLVMPPSGLLEHQPGRLLRLLQRRAAARQAGVGHEVGMCAERLRRRAHAPEGTLGLENPALGLIIQVGDHDLVEDLLVNRCILDRYRSEEHTSELQSLMRISYAVFCLKKKNKVTTRQTSQQESNSLRFSAYTYNT